jgi:hypothetical protein
MTWKDFIANEKRLYSNSYYWLKILMTILACALTINISFWLYVIFVVFIWGSIKYEYPEDLPLKEHDRIIFHDNTGMHDYYFVRYADKNQVQAYITIFPGGEATFEKLVDVNSISKER